MIAGLGNIYTDEILHAPGCATTGRANTLTAQEIRRLYRAMVEILHDAVAAAGQQPGRRAVRRPLRPARHYQDHHQVYGREGKACRRCRATDRAGEVGAAARPTTAPAARSDASDALEPLRPSSASSAGRAPRVRPRRDGRY